MISKTVAARFAALYVNGTAEFRGNWARVSEWMGFKTAPSTAEPVLVAAIAALGGHAPLAIPASTSQEHVGATEPEGPDYETVFDAEELIAEAEQSAIGSEWTVMADRLRGVMENVARTGMIPMRNDDGEIRMVKASAAQVAALKVIFDRAEGRVAEKTSTKAAPLGIVRLPSEDFVCPKCGWRQE